MAPTDEQGRIRVYLPGGGTAATDHGDVYGWATSAPGNQWERDGGYTVEWDDGVKDVDITRWYFDNGDIFDIKAV